jgi:Bacterial Ig-like domain
MSSDRTQPSSRQHIVPFPAETAERRLRRIKRRPYFDNLEDRALLSITSVTGINPLTPHPLVGNSYTGSVAQFTATDAGPFSATINWGDGHLSAGSFTNNGGGNFTVTGTNTFTTLTIPGIPDNVTATIVDSTDPPGTAPSVANSTAVVDDVPIVASPTMVSAFRGIQTALVDVATFTVANPFASASTYTATINWGDGSNNTAGVIIEDAGQVFHIEGSHAYANVGAFSIGVSIQNAGGSSAVLAPPTPATVINSNITAQGVPVVATAGVALNNVVVGSFTDSGGTQTITNYAATIDWGDGSAPTTATLVNVGGSNYDVEGSHTYATGGNFATTETIDANVVPAAVAHGQASIAFAPPVATPIDFTTPERQQFNGVIASFVVATGTVTQPASDYLATVDWGDGTAPTQGRIAAIPGGYLVSGVHTYADIPSATSVSYPVTMTVDDLVGHTSAQVTSHATVTAITIPLAASLNPATDTGESHTDAITGNPQPAFLGTSESFVTITLTATPVGGGSPILLGTTQTGLSGAWSIVSGVPLASGQYTLSAKAVDQAGVNSTTIQVLPNATQGALTIDTIGPKVTGFQFDPLTGQFAVTYQDNLSGLNQSELVNGANYSVTTRLNRTPLKLGHKFIITSLTTSPPASPSGTQTVIGTINNGMRLRGGLFTFSIISGGASGIQDVAGTALDGEFYGFFPSGNNVSGGNFVTRINFINGVGSPPLAENSSASPLSPPGTSDTGFRVKTIRLPGHQVEIRSTGPSSPLNQNALYIVKGNKLVPVARDSIAKLSTRTLKAKKSLVDRAARASSVHRSADTHRS